MITGSHRCDIVIMGTHTYHGLTQASSNKRLKFLLAGIPSLLHLGFLVLSLLWSSCNVATAIRN